MLTPERGECRGKMIATAYVEHDDLRRICSACRRREFVRANTARLEPGASKRLDQTVVGAEYGDLGHTVTSRFERIIGSGK
jgi:hypothetical protein